MRIEVQYWGPNHARQTTTHENAARYHITTEGVCIMRSPKQVSTLITMASAEELDTFYPHSNLLRLQILE